MKNHFLQEAAGAKCERNRKIVLLGKMGDRSVLPEIWRICAKYQRMISEYLSNGCGKSNWVECNWWKRTLGKDWPIVERS